jgi:gliding motility-associated-like protein
MITAAGGTRPYMYAWSAPTVTTDSFAVALAAGWHFVTVTDFNSCTYIDSFEVLQPAQITTTMTVDSVSCFGGSDGIGSVTAAGGNSGFTYAWSDGITTTTNITGLAAGWHYVTVTDVNMCFTVDSIEVLEPIVLTSSTTVVNVLCNGAATGTATVTGTGGTLSYTYLWDVAAANQTTATATGLAAGSYDVTVTDLNGCTSISTAVITEPATAVSSTISGTNLLCNGDNSGTATAQGVDGTPGAITPYTYLWNDINNQTAATATGLAAGTYIVTVTDGNNCITTNTITLTEPVVLSGTTAGTPASCFGVTDGTAMITAAGGTRPYMYAWSAPTVTTDSFAVALAAGWHFVTVTDFNSCTYIDSFEVLQPTQIMTSTTVTPVACNGDSTGTGTVAVTGGNGGETYLWSFNNQTTVTATGLPAGWHYITVTDVNMCSTTDSVEILEPTLLTLSTSQVDVGCFGDATGSATATPTGGTAGYTYLWDINAGSQTSQTATNLPAGNFVVTVTDANGCSDTISVTINQPATAVTIDAVTFTQVSCFGGSDGTATAQVTGGTGAYTYNWVGTGQTNQTVTGLPIGTYNVIVTDANGCFAIDSVTIDEPSPITTIFTNVGGSSCNGGTDGTATVAASGGVPNGTNGYTYVWNTVPQQQGATAVNLSGGQTYMVIVTDANGCTTNNQVTIPQPDPVTLTTSTVNVTCFGLSDGEATVVAAGGTPGYTFLWDANANNQTTATATGLAFGGYSVTVTDFFGCLEVTSVIITQPAPLTTNESTVDILCKGENTGEAQVLISGGTAPYLILWENGIANPPMNLAVGTYSYTVTDVNNCELIDSITINEPATELAATNTSTDVICYDDRNGTIEITATGGITPYKYSLDGVNYDNANTRVGLIAGDYTYYVKDDNGCIFNEDVTISEPDEFTVSLGADLDIQLGEVVNLNVSTTDGIPTYTYLWTPDEGLSCNDCGNPILDSLQNDRYITVMVTDSRGCEAEDDIYVRISKPRYVFVANAFTPNGDGNNDFLFVQGGNGSEKVLSFRVYDRWGELVYEAKEAPLNDTSFGWDGTYKGQNSDGSVFVWYSEVEFSDGETAVYKGSTVLIR